MTKEEIQQRMSLFIRRRLQEEHTINAMMAMNIVSCDDEHQMVTLNFPIQAWQLNPAGHMHGGMLATAMDISMGCAAYTFSQAAFTPTIQFAINFVKSIPNASILRIEAYCDHSGSRMVQTRAIAYLMDSDEVAATANGSYAINK